MNEVKDQFVSVFVGVELPIDELALKVGDNDIVHLDVHLYGPEKRMFLGLVAALRRRGDKMTGGRPVYSHADALRWMMQQAACADRRINEADHFLSTATPAPDSVSGVQVTFSGSGPVKPVPADAINPLTDRLTRNARNATKGARVGGGVGEDNNP